MSVEWKTGTCTRTSLADLYVSRSRTKNWHWHNRYRATDGNDIWGGRSTLTFVDGQSNADVLEA